MGTGACGFLDAALPQTLALPLDSLLIPALLLHTALRALETTCAGNGLKPQQVFGGLSAEEIRKTESDKEPQDTNAH